MKNPSTLGSIKKQRSYTMPLCVFCKRLLRCAVPGPVEEERGKKSKFMRIYNHIHTGKTTFYKHVPTLSWSVCRLSRYSSSCLARSARHSCKSYKATLTNVKNIQSIYDWHWFIFKVPRLKLKKDKSLHQQNLLLPLHHLLLPLSLCHEIPLQPAKHH